jgi:hypothetical protein
MGLFLAQGVFDAILSFFRSLHSKKYPNASYFSHFSIVFLLWHVLQNPEKNHCFARFFFLNFANPLRIMPQWQTTRNSLTIYNERKNSNQKY